MNPVSTQKTGHYCSTAGDGMSGLGPPPGDCRARNFVLHKQNNNKLQQQQEKTNKQKQQEF